MKLAIFLNGLLGGFIAGYVGAGFLEQMRFRVRSPDTRCATELRLCKISRGFLKIYADAMDLPRKGELWVENPPLSSYGYEEPTNKKLQQALFPSKNDGSASSGHLTDFSPILS